VPASAAPKLIEPVGEIVAAACKAVPLTARNCGLCGSLSEIRTWAERLPACVGSKVTFITQVLPPARGLCVQLSVSAKSPGFVPAVLMVMATAVVPLLPTVTTCTTLLAPTVCEEKFNVAGDSEILDVPPIPLSVTPCGPPSALLEMLSVARAPELARLSDCSPPQTDQQLRINRRPSPFLRTALDGLIRGMQVQAPYQCPNRSRRMVFADEVFHIHSSPTHLLSVHLANQRLFADRIFLAHAASLRQTSFFARWKFRGFLHSFNVTFPGTRRSASLEMTHYPTAVRGITTWPRLPFPTRNFPRPEPAPACHRRAGPRWASRLPTAPRSAGAGGARADRITRAPWLLR